MSYLALNCCFIGYILLSAPIENSHYGGIRNVLLFLTDITPYVIFWVTLVQLNDRFTLISVSKWLMYPALLWFLLLAYNFLVLAGDEPLHQINHGVAIAVLLISCYLAVREFFDDLNNQRRNIRLLIIILCSMYMIGLVTFELMSSAMRNTWQFSLINAMLIFFITLLITVRTLVIDDRSNLSDARTSKRLLCEENPKLAELNHLMQQGIFLNSELTIGKLAEELTIPPHQLRQLINQELGFNNFSHYLNSYRIPWVCEQLKDPTKNKIPVLTLALEAGYGSIAPFNRAFKTLKGQTPTQYRDQFQK
ncbi:helix-turn-helix domain-containing protein [Pseudoalteromonas byunsanensis]|uniref:helix-turn-helix domain-containing protein n=1 Tax=Pseudoalteromonas byunsanensis TaxID=327939 RepID=UPI001585D867|nr:helix-turn-helix domain-containing protein [Pseudoalteromonas byunsanensis]